MGAAVQQVVSSVQDYVSWSVNRFWTNKKTSSSVVEVQAFAGSTMVTMGDKKCTPVMVRVAAPPREKQPRTPVDVVVVLNTSESMEGMRTQMKDAMIAVIKKLDGKDRLSLVTLEEESVETMELVHMDESGRLTAEQRIQSITTTRSWYTKCSVTETVLQEVAIQPQLLCSSNGLSYEQSSTNTESLETMELMHREENGRLTTEQRIQSITTTSSWSTECSVTETVLQKVVVQMKKSSSASEERLRCVMLLSCAQDQVDMTRWITEVRNHKFQFHTFDIGAQQHDAGRFKCVAEAGAGVYYHYMHVNASITDAFGNFVAGLKTVVATSVSVELSLKAEAAESGFSILSLGRQTAGADHHIHITDMHAGEKKSFVVYLHSSTSDVTTTTVEKILSIRGEYYKQGRSSSSCLLLRSTKEMIKNEAVAAEVVRSMLVKQVKETMVEMEQTTAEVTHEQILQEKWETIKASDVYKVASSTELVKLIEEDVNKMTVQGGRVHMMSWLSCHLWQRATTMSHYSDAFRSTTPPKGKGSAAARGWEQPCVWVVGVVCLVLMVILLGRFIIPGRRRPLLPAVSPTALDVGKHPEWPSMVSDLEGVLSRAKEDRITSFFKAAPASDMNQQIDQYLYMAILYASVLRARYDGTSAFSEKVVRRHAETYIQSMLTRTKSGALPNLQVASTEDTTKAMTQYLYSTIVQTEVLVTIRPPAPGPGPDDDIGETEKLRDENKTLRKEIPDETEKLRDENETTKLREENENLRKEMADETEKLRDENKTLRDEITELRKQIEKLRSEKESCCQQANECKQKAAKNSN